MTNLGLKFRQVEDGHTLPESLHFDVNFYEADICVDAILSYPWMVQAKVGVFPHYNALAIDKPRFTLLYGLPRNSKGYVKPWNRNYAYEKGEEEYNSYTHEVRRKRKRRRRNYEK